MRAKTSHAKRPRTEDAEYDVDSVCEFAALTKAGITQKDLKEKLGVEVESYRQSKNMDKPLKEGRRCWTLQYADGAKFHMDIVPALSNEDRLRKLLAEHKLNDQFASTAIAITDNEVSNYSDICEDWPRSNPKGYCEWFKTRMAVVLEKGRRRIAEKMQASVEEIPDYKVRTPLQSAIMLLKQHRDISFAERADEAPISIIITTLSAKAYEGEEKIGAALKAILTKMDRFITEINGVYVITNPTDELENFADKWADHPERAKAFFEWLDMARRDFDSLAKSADRDQMERLMEGSVGRDLAKRARQRRLSAAPAVLTKGLIKDAVDQNPNAVNLKGGGRYA
ncbi:nucleotidyltransferase [Methylosinus sp. RM1]|uniref:nucleotidyltransferase n=1 Tax=Methylosinus sp. RM1 TaxID=2583817 RepID=UPI001409456D|nr:nucleotidyltransferase [Methylosinus sp. RM1]